MLDRVHGPTTRVHFPGALYHVISRAIKAREFSKSIQTIAVILNKGRGRTGSQLRAEAAQVGSEVVGIGTVIPPDDRSKYTLAFAADGRVSARIDCNRASASWKSSGRNQLEFGSLAIARAMCPPGPLHDRIVNHWPCVRSYMITNGHLYLSLMADGGVYEFEPVR